MGVLRKGGGRKRTRKRGSKELLCLHRLRFAASHRSCRVRFFVSGLVTKPALTDFGASLAAGVLLCGSVLVGRWLSLSSHWSEQSGVAGAKRRPQTLRGLSSNCSLGSGFLAASQAACSGVKWSGPRIKGQAIGVAMGLVKTRRVLTHRRWTGVVYGSFPSMASTRVPSTDACDNVRCRCCGEKISLNL
jgi:hypothetical protein